METCDEGQAEGSGDRLRPVLASTTRASRETVDRIRRRGDRRHRRDPVVLQRQHALGIRGRRTAVEPHGVPGSQLAVLHTGSRAITSSSRRSTASTRSAWLLGDVSPDQGDGHGRPAAAHRPRSTATSTITHTVFYEYPSGVRVTSPAGSRTTLQRSSTRIVLGTKGRRRFSRSGSKANAVAASRPATRAEPSMYQRRARGAVRQHSQTASRSTTATTCATAR